MRRGSCSHNGAGRCRARTVESLEPRRLMAAGALDSTFAGGGIAAFDVLNSDGGDDVLVQPDGKVVLVGAADL